MAGWALHVAAPAKTGRHAIVFLPWVGNFPERGIAGGRVLRKAAPANRGATHVAQRSPFSVAAFPVPAMAKGRKATERALRYQLNAMDKGLYDAKVNPPSC